MKAGTEPVNFSFRLVVLAGNYRKAGLRMKQFLAILLIVIGLYIFFFNPYNLPWLPFGNQGTSTKVTGSSNRIQVDVAGINAAIVPTSGNTVKAKLKGRGRVSVKKAGDTIRINVKRKWVPGFLFKRTKLTVYLPKDYNRQLKLDMASGNLNVTGVSPNRPIKLDSLDLDMASGNARLKNLAVKHFAHNGLSGNLDIESLSAASGSIAIRSGNVRLRHYTGSVKAELLSGNMNLQMDELKGSINTEVRSGHLNIDLPSRSSFKLNGNVRSGTITCDFPLKSKTVSTQKVEGTYGSGKEKINLNVLSGAVKIH